MGQGRVRGAKAEDKGVGSHEQPLLQSLAYQLSNASSIKLYSDFLISSIYDTKKPNVLSLIHKYFIDSIDR